MPMIIMGVIMKKIRNILLLAIAIILVVGASHTILDYISLLGKPTNSAPAWVAIFNMIPYTIASVACGVVAIVLEHKIHKNNMH